MAAQSRNIAELENASVWRLLIQYSLPSIAGMVVYSLYNIIDSVFIGHGVGPLALSGLAVTFPIMNLTFALGTDRKSTRLNSSHTDSSRMPSSA